MRRVISAGVEPFGFYMDFLCNHNEITSILIFSFNTEFFNYIIDKNLSYVVTDCTFCN